MEQEGNVELLVVDRELVRVERLQRAPIKYATINVLMSTVEQRTKKKKKNESEGRGGEGVHGREKQREDELEEGDVEGLVHVDLALVSLREIELVPLDDVLRAQLLDIVQYTCSPPNTTPVRPRVSIPHIPHKDLVPVRFSMSSRMRRLVDCLTNRSEGSLCKIRCSVVVRSRQFGWVNIAIGGRVR